MHNIQLKNKRGKVVATLQWERPEDLINWANSIANESGKEFRNVDPEVPVKLEAIAAPVHKLKIVAKEQTLSVKTHSDIQTLLQSISENLHEEFEILMCKNFVNENTLSEKKNQINVLNEITEALFDLSQLQEKTEMCLMNYGISEMEYMNFIRMPMEMIIAQLTEMREERSVQLPDIFTQVLDYTVKEKQPEKEIRIAEKPLHGLTKLMEMSKSGIKFAGTWSLKEEIKKIDSLIEKHKRGDDLCTGT